MCNVYEKYRLQGTNNEAFCFIDVVVEWNSNPGTVDVFVSNNGIFDTEGTDTLFFDGADATPNSDDTFNKDLITGTGVSEEVQHRKFADEI